MTATITTIPVMSSPGTYVAAASWEVDTQVTLACPQTRAWLETSGCSRMKSTKALA